MKLSPLPGAALFAGVILASAMAFTVTAGDADEQAPAREVPAPPAEEARKAPAVAGEFTPEKALDKFPGRETIGLPVTAPGSIWL